MHRSYMLWSFSTYPLPGFLFNHAQDGRDLLNMRPCPKPVPWSPSPDTLPILCQPHLGPCFRGPVLLFPDAPRQDSTPFYSRTQHLWSTSFLPLSFSLLTLFFLSCPKFARFWEFRICGHHSLCLSPTSFAKSSWEGAVFSHGMVIMSVGAVASCDKCLLPWKLQCPRHLSLVLSGGSIR